MAYEVSKSMAYKSVQVTTPLSGTQIDLMNAQPVLITILRASLPFYDGFLEVFDNADSGFIGEYRKEGTQEVDIKLDYMAVPNIDGRNVLFVDPMLATGKSLIKAVDHLRTKGEPRYMHFVSAVAAPEGIDYISKKIEKDFTIWTAAMDERLNDSAYIVPGLGDAGDLCYGPKL